MVIAVIIELLIDTDIGTDVDDAFALALAMRSPELRLEGVSTVSGDTVARGRIATKMLSLGGFKDVPVVAGIPSRAPLTHGSWASEVPFDPREATIDRLVNLYWGRMEHARSFPVHILALGPLTNIATVRDHDPATFDERASIVMMGGSIKKGYFGLRVAMPEYNIVQDKVAARAILESEVSVRVVPLDVTANLALRSTHLAAFNLAAERDPLARGLMDMAALFRRTLMGRRAPVMFDPATVAVVVDETLGFFEPMDLKVTRTGFTRRIDSRDGIVPPSSKNVCMAFDKVRFFDMFLSRLTGNQGGAAR